MQTLRVLGAFLVFTALGACSDNGNKGKGIDLATHEMANGGFVVDMRENRDLLATIADDLSATPGDLLATSTDDLSAPADDLSAPTDDLSAPGDDLTPPPDLLIADLAPLVTGCQPPAPYTPLDAMVLDIPSAELALWIRADVGLSLDPQSRVCSADDQSGNDHHFTQATATNRPTLGTLGSRPAIAYVGLQELSRPDVLEIDPLSPRTIYVVFALDATSARSTPFMQGDLSTNDVYLGVDANTFMTSTNKYGVYMTGNAYDGDAATTGDPVIQSQRVDSMEIGEPILDHMTSRLNGRQLALTETPGGSGVQVFEDFSTAHSTSVGYPRTGMDMQIAEVLVWSRALTALEIDKVEAYLAARYGVTLAE